MSAREQPVRKYLEARIWAAKENVNDLVDAVRAGYYEEVIHALGVESPSIISQRAQVRRAYARQLARGKTVSPPSLPKIQPGQLKVS